MATKNTAEIELKLKGDILKQYKTVRKDLVRNNKQISKSLKEVEKTSTTTFSKFKTAVKEGGSEILSFAKRFGLAAVVIGAFTLGMRSAGDGIDFVREKTTVFQKTMSRLQAIIGPRGAQKDFDALAAKAKELGGATVFSATQAGNAFVELSKLGLSTNQILKSSTAVLSLAAAAEADMATAAAVTAETLAQFSLSASESTRVTDIMAKSFNISALDITRFSEAMKFVGPTAGALNITLETTTAALATLSKSAITGSMAGTALRRIMLDLGDANSKAAKLINRADFATLSFTKKLEILQSKNLSPARIKQTFGLLSTTAATVLIKGTQSVIDFEEQLKNAQGTAKEMADTMIDNVAGATIILQSAQESLGLAIGETFSDAKQKRIEAYTNFIKRATELVKAHEKELVSFAGAIDFIISETGRFAKQGVKDVAIFSAKITAGMDFIKGNFLRLAANFNDPRFGFGGSEETRKKSIEFLESYQRQLRIIEGIQTGKPFRGPTKEDIEALNKIPLSFLKDPLAISTRFDIQPGPKLPPLPIEDIEIDDTARKRASKRKKEADRAIEASKRVQNELLILSLSGQEKELEKIRQFEASKRAIILKSGDDLKLLDQVVEDQRRAVREKFINEEIEKNQKLINLEKEKQDEIAKLLEEADLKAVTARDNRIQDEKAAKEAIVNASISGVVDFSNALAGLSSVNSRNEEKRAREAGASEAEIQKIRKKAFEDQKLFQLVQATGNIALGITNAIGRGGILGLAEGAFITAAGAIQLSTISAQEFARGGVVRGGQETGDTIPIRANAGEVIFTKNQFKNLIRMTEQDVGGSVNFGDINIVVNGNANGVEVGEAVARTIQEKLRTLAKDNRRTRGLQLRPV